MIKSIELQNFKAFGSRIKVPLAPITLIFGENSSGKSSILQSLNLLKQTADRRESGAILLPRSEGGFVDLGGFQEMIYNHDLRRKLRIKIELSADDLSLPPFLRRQFSDISDKVSIQYTFKRPTIKDEIKLDSLELFLSDSQKYFAKFEPTELTNAIRRELMFTPFYDRNLRRNDIYALKCTDLSYNELFWQKTFDIYLDNIKTILKSLKTLFNRLEKDGKKHKAQESLWGDMPINRYYSIDLNKLKKALEFYASDINPKALYNRAVSFSSLIKGGLYGVIPFSSSRIGIDPVVDSALRYETDRVWRTFNREIPNIGQILNLVGRIMERTLTSLFPMGPYRIPPKRWYLFSGTNPNDVGFSGDLMPDLLYRDRSILKSTNRWLKKLDIGYKIVTKSVSQKTKDLFEVRLVDTRCNEKVDVTLSDVGYGVSQILPFIVQSLAAEHQIISIEQPEVHIHPRLQADLGDLLADAIASPSENQFLIETHSEHLVLRIQRLIRSKVLKNGDVSVIYVARGDKGSNVTQLRLDENGDFIDEWPGGFFPERMKELL